jgi:hypothetical protein
VGRSLLLRGAGLLLAVIGGLMVVRRSREAA